MSASTLWTTCKQTRYTELNLRAILASGTKQQRASLAAELDAECSSLSAILCEMRGLRNACRPVFALPTEVFLRIVTLLAEDCPPAWYVSGYNQRLRETMGLGWLLVSHVCKAWRSTCYSAIELWPLSEDHRVAHQATLSAVTSERPELRQRLDRERQLAETDQTQLLWHSPASSLSLHPFFSTIGSTSSSHRNVA